MISTQTPKNPIKRLDVFYVLSEGVVVAGDVESKSRKGLLHYTRIVLDPLTMKITKASCDCEASAFGKKCWHVKTLEELVKTDLKKEVEKVREEMLAVEEDIASWR